VRKWIELSPLKTNAFFEKIINIYEDITKLSKFKIILNKALNLIVGPNNITSHPF
jgi:hypothetical protein